MSKQFLSLVINFFEPYHGKSLVDGMFGMISTWISEWKKSHFINSTEDLFDCLIENTKFLDNANSIIYYEFKPDVGAWAQSYPSLPHKIKIQNVNVFQIRQSQPGYLTTYTLEFGIENEQVVFKGCKTEKVATKTRAQKKVNKSPKFSKDIEITNTNSLTTLDQDLLRTKAKAWKIAMDVEVEDMEIEDIEIEGGEVEV